MTASSPAPATIEMANDNGKPAPNRVPGADNAVTRNGHASTAITINGAIATASSNGSVRVRSRKPASDSSPSRYQVAGALAPALAPAFAAVRSTTFNGQYGCANARIDRPATDRGSTTHD